MCIREVYIVDGHLKLKGKGHNRMTQGTSTESKQRCSFSFKLYFEAKIFKPIFADKIPSKWFFTQNFLRSLVQDRTGHPFQLI